jgi:UDP-N-acetylmuramate-alanine ligase
MASLAAMLQESGYEVSGSDDGIYPPMSDFLAQKQIRVTQGYDLKHLQPEPDLVVTLKSSMCSISDSPSFPSRKLLKSSFFAT